MKKRSKAISVLLTLAMVLSLLPAAALPARADDPTPDLVIDTDAKWAAFAENVNSGANDYSGKLVALGGDVTVTTPVGVSGDNERPFKGTFDGRGYTLTAAINEMVESGNETFPYIYDGAPQGTAPFRVIEGATVRNLKVAGEVKGGWHTAGLVGFSRGSNNLIENCCVATTVRNDKYVGGILGHGTNSSVTVQNCVFKGFLLPGNEAKGVFLGWGDQGGTKLVRHCLYVWPAQYGTDAQNDYQLDFVKKSDGSVTVEDCYYRTLNGAENNKFTCGRLAYTKAYAQSQQQSNLYKKLSFYGESVDYYGLCKYGGVNEKYFYTGEAISIVPTADGEAITAGVAITYTYYPSSGAGVPVDVVREPGNYLMTIAGNGDDFIGTRRFEFDVVDSIPYIDADGTQKTLNMAAVGAKQVTAGEATWGAADAESWYVLAEDVSFSSSVTVHGTVNLLLCNGKTMEVGYTGIRVSEGNKLTVWAQSEGESAGRLNAVPSFSNYAGIGGSQNENCGEIVINGGNITAKGQSDAAGIGGGNGRAGGTITINGGTVKAQSQSCGAGIGGGRGASGGTITINGGYVDTSSTTGNAGAAGIGGGAPSSAEGGTGGDGGTIVINGGTVIAQGRAQGSAIGGGAGAAGKTSIIINGGKITTGIKNGEDGTHVGIGIPVGSTGTCTVLLSLSNAGDYIRTTGLYGYAPTCYNATVTLAAGKTVYNGLTAYAAGSEPRVFTAEELASFAGGTLSSVVTLSGIGSHLYSHESYDPENPTVLRLPSDVAAASEDETVYISPNTYAVLDLNGHRITTDCAGAHGFLTTFEVSGSLTVTDTSSAKNGAVTLVNRDKSDCYSTSFASVVPTHEYNSDTEKNEITGCGTLSLDAGAISGYDECVYVDGGAFRMTGGTITENEYGVIVSNGAFDMTGGTITKNEYGVMSDAPFTVSGTPTVSDNREANVFLMIDGGGKAASPNEQEPVITVAGTLKTGASIGVTRGYFDESGRIRTLGGVFAAADAGYKSGRLDESDKAFFFSDANLPIELDKAGRLMMVKPEWAELQALLDAAAAASTEEGRLVTLTADYVADEGDEPLVITSGTVTLDLNGHVIDRNAYSSSEPKSGSITPYPDDSEADVGDGCAIVVKNASLTLRDSGTATRWGYWENMRYVVTAQQPASGDYDVLAGGVITGADDMDCGAIYVSGGTLAMAGGTIAGNCGGSGGGVTVASGSMFLMTGGTVVGNYGYCGGGVFIGECGYFVMSGGTIEGNYATSGGGVFVSNYATFQMGGSAGELPIGPVGPVEPVGSKNGEAAPEPPRILGNTTYMMRESPMLVEASGESTPLHRNFWIQPGSGGGVLVFENGVFRMADGEISGNCGCYGGGVLLMSPYSTFEVSGGATVIGNTQSLTAIMGGEENPYTLRGDSAPLPLYDSPFDMIDPEDQTAGNVVLYTYGSEMYGSTHGSEESEMLKSSVVVAGALSGRIGVTLLLANYSGFNGTTTGIFALPAAKAHSAPSVGLHGNGDGEEAYAAITASDLACFFSDDAGLGVRLDAENGVAYLAKADFSLSGSLTGAALTYTVTDTPADALLIVAWYDAGGRMLGAKTVRIARGVSVTDTITVNQKTARWKLMLVDAASYAPLCAAYDGKAA